MIDRRHGAVELAAAATLAVEAVECRAGAVPRAAGRSQGLIADGWYEVARKGSHAQFRHNAKPGRVSVPHPKRDIPIGTLAHDPEIGIDFGKDHAQNQSVTASFCASKGRAAL